MGIQSLNVKRLIFFVKMKLLPFFAATALAQYNGRPAGDERPCDFFEMKATAIFDDGTTMADNGVMYDGASKVTGTITLTQQLVVQQVQEVTGIPSKPHWVLSILAKRNEKLVKSETSNALVAFAMLMLTIILSNFMGLET